MAPAIRREKTLTPKSSALKSYVKLMRHPQHWYFPQFRCNMRKISAKRYRRAKLTQRPRSRLRYIHLLTLRDMCCLLCKYMRICAWMCSFEVSNNISRPTPPNPTPHSVFIRLIRNNKRNRSMILSTRRLALIYPLLTMVRHWSFW